ncbi:MAG: tyrosine-type recombinase/integrase [Pseudomonadota bacterium]
MIKVEPIRDLKAIKRIKKLREDHGIYGLRDLCLFTLGINTAYRANELLSLTINQVDYLTPGDRLEIKQSKTGKIRPTTVNKTVVDALDRWLDAHPLAHHPRAPLFISSRGDAALTVSSLTNMVKAWCQDVGLRGNYGSHTLRKTWGYHQLRINNAPIPLLMEAYGHATQRQTLDYLCIEADEIRELYAMEL